jgi:hypothetical protein
MCKRWSGHAPVTMRVSKEAIRRLVAMEGLPDGDDLIRAAYGSRDFKIGVNAFLDKQRPSGPGPEHELSMTSKNNKTPGPLAGMRVLELAQIMAGPTCGMMLADMGADVIKVEKLPGGDDARGYREPRVNGVSAPFMILNRNKRGIALNLKHPQGRDILLRMVKEADVLTENYRRGTLERLGLGYDTLSKVNPGLIYCAVSGYGRDGPDGDKPAST